MITDQLENFFDRLYRYCAGFIEIRPLPGEQGYFELGDIGKIKEYFSRWANADIYFGVGTRDGHGGKAENVLQLPAVWADCDFKQTPRAVLFKRLNGFLCKPTIIIKSGGGAHFYWLLSEPAAPEDFNSIVDANRRIAARLGGDPAATDVARILRPPSTLNRKYTPPRRVELTVCDRFEYDLQFFLDELPAVETNTSGNASVPEGNPEGWLVEALKGIAQGTTGRNPTGAKIAGYFINKLPPRDIIAILTAWNTHNTPPLKQSEISKIVRSVSRYKSQQKRSANYEVDLQIE